MDSISKALDALDALVFMGACGCGKSTIAEAFAQRHGLVFLDADDYHPASNIEKMSKGMPLDDDDRRPWYGILNKLIVERSRKGEKVALACSALKQVYREWLAQGGVKIRYVLLDGDYDTLKDRMDKRTDHFMPPSLIASQLETLEKPGDAIAVDIRQSVESILTNIDFGLLEQTQP